MIFFNKESKTYKKNCWWGGGGEGGKGVARVSDFLNKNPNLKYFFLFVREVGMGVGVLSGWGME